MKINIKPLLTGTTLVVASTTGIMADPPKTITHPVFGAMKGRISHKEDLDFYHQKVKDPNKPLENEYDEGLLAQNFIKYVLNADSLEQASVPQGDIENFVDECCWSQAGMAALKVITANYMREYDRIEQFCKDHKGDLKTCYDFSQTEKGKALYEKERQIFELEEKLKELFFKTNRNNKDVLKLEISREDLMNLYKHFSKEDSLLKDSESWLKTLKQKDDYGFCITSYRGILTVYKHFQSEQTGDFRIGCWAVQCGSNRYKRLETFYTENKQALGKLINDIGSLCLSGNTIEPGSECESGIRCFYSEYKKDLKVLSELCSTAALGELGNQDVRTQNYKETTKEANEKKFSCIRRSVMPACYFPILYRHFFVENDPEYSTIEAVNKFLYRALKLEDDDEFCTFVQETLSIGLRKEPEEIKNYHVDFFGKFSAFTGDRCDSLLHELMHFMNAIDCFEAAENAPDISLNTSENIKKNIEVVVSKLEFSREDIYPKKEKKENEEDKEEDEEAANAESDGEFTDDELDDIRSKLEDTLGNLYDKACETWTMYGIFICQDKQNPEKYEFYYDPINEAVANVECKIIDGNKRQVVRTGHCMFDDQNRIDSDDETSSLTIKVLAKKIGIYRFYFDNDKGLRELIDK